MCRHCQRLTDAVDPICDTCGRALPTARLLPVHAAQVARLRQVAGALRGCAGAGAPVGADLDTLWGRTHAQLVELADGARPPDRTAGRWYRRLLRFLGSW